MSAKERLLSPVLNYIIVPGGIHVHDSKRAEFVLQVLDFVVPVWLAHVAAEAAGVEATRGRLYVDALLGGRGRARLVAWPDVKAHLQLHTLQGKKIALIKKKIKVSFYVCEEIQNEAVAKSWLMASSYMVK